jgi:hypothetical protein
MSIAVQGFVNQFRSGMVRDDPFGTGNESALAGMGGIDGNDPDGFRCWAVTAYRRRGPNPGLAPPRKEEYSTDIDGCRIWLKVDEAVTWPEGRRSEGCSSAQAELARRMQDSEGVDKDRERWNGRNCGHAAPNGGNGRSDPKHRWRSEPTSLRQRPLLEAPSAGSCWDAASRRAGGGAAAAVEQFRDSAGPEPVSRKICTKGYHRMKEHGGKRDP